MNLNRILFVILACASTHLMLHAQSVTNNVNASIATNPPASLEAKSPALIQPRATGVRLGGSDFIVDGLAVEPFRREPETSVKRSLREKILGAPLVNPLAPGRSRAPIRRENYFAWGQRDTPWSVLADRPIPGPQSVLVSVSR